MNRGSRAASFFATPVTSRRMTLPITSRSSELWWLNMKTAGLADHAFSLPLIRTLMPQIVRARSGPKLPTRLAPVCRFWVSRPAETPNAAAPISAPIAVVVRAMDIGSAPLSGGRRFTDGQPFCRAVAASLRSGFSATGCPTDFSIGTSSAPLEYAKLSPRSAPCLSAYSRSASALAGPHSGAESSFPVSIPSRIAGRVHSTSSGSMSRSAATDSA